MPPLNLTYNKQQAAFIGEPVSDIKATTAAINKRYHENLDKSDIMATAISNIPVAREDQNIVADEMNKFQTDLSTIIKSGRYEDAAPVIRQSAREFNTNKKVKAAIRNKQDIDSWTNNLQERLTSGDITEDQYTYALLQDQSKYKGVGEADDLGFYNTRFRGFNPAKFVDIPALSEEFISNYKPDGTSFISRLDHNNDGIIDEYVTQKGTHVSADEVGEALTRHISNNANATKYLQEKANIESIKTGETVSPNTLLSNEVAPYSEKAAFNITELSTKAPRGVGTDRDTTFGGGLVTFEGVATRQIAKSPDSAAKLTSLRKENAATITDVNTKLANPETLSSSIDKPALKASKGLAISKEIYYDDLEQQATEESGWTDENYVKELDIAVQKSDNYVKTNFDQVPNDRNITLDAKNKLESMRQVMQIIDPNINNMQEANREIQRLSTEANVTEVKDQAKILEFNIRPKLIESGYTFEEIENIVSGTGKIDSTTGTGLNIRGNSLRRTSDGNWYSTDRPLERDKADSYTREVNDNRDNDIDNWLDENAKPYSTVFRGHFIPTKVGKAKVPLLDEINSAINTPSNARIYIDGESGEVITDIDDYPKAPKKSKNDKVGEFSTEQVTSRAGGKFYFPIVDEEGKSYYVHLLSPDLYDELGDVYIKKGRVDNDIASLKKGISLKYNEYADVIDNLTPPRVGVDGPKHPIGIGLGDDGEDKPLFKVGYSSGTSGVQRIVFYDPITNEKLVHTDGQKVEYRSKAEAEEAMTLLIQARLMQIEANK